MTHSPDASIRNLCSFAVVSTAVALFAQAGLYYMAIPQFAAMFEDMDIQLPTITNILMSITQPPVLVFLPPLAFTLLMAHYAYRKTERQTLAVVGGGIVYIVLSMVAFAGGVYAPLLKIIETTG